MHDTPNRRQQAHEQLREGLTDAIMSEIEEQVVAVIPSEFSIDTRKAILTEILPEARFNLDALSTAHLQSNCAIDRHVDRAVATAEFLVHRIMAHRASSITESVCPDCDGAGVFDLFEYDMPCERCAGTGIVPDCSKSE